MNTVTDTPVNEEIEKLLANIDAVPHGHVWILDPGDLWYREPETFTVLRASQLVATVDELRAERDDPDRYSVFGDFFDLTGRRIPGEERTEEWYEANDASINGKFTAQNTAYRAGSDHIYIARGAWKITGETAVDGEVAFEFTEYRTWQLAEREKEKEQHRAEVAPYMPAIDVAAPDWAEPITASEISIYEWSDELDFSYTSPNRLDGNLGSAYLDQFATINKHTKKVELAADVQLYIYIEDNQSRTADELRAIASGLLALADDAERCL